MTETRSTPPDWLEILATVLLALAAVATAWSSYQANRWNGEQVKAASQANAARIESARTAGLATSQTEVDIATFVEWVDATLRDEVEIADFYRDRFREEFRPPFEAWLATDPFTSATAPATPFAMDEYRLEAAERAAELDAIGEAAAADVRRNIQRSTNYVLGVVLFAVALFFAGVSTKLPSSGPRKAMLAAGWIVFLADLAWIATFPVSITV